MIADQTKDTEPLRVDGFTFERLEGRPAMLMRWDGEATKAGLLALLRFGQAVAAECGPGQHAQLLIDATEATNIGPGARRVIPELAREPVWAQVAVVGVDAGLRIVLDLVIRAVELLAIAPTDTRFFDSHAEANAWLEREASQQDC